MKSKRRWLHFSLRQLCALIAVVAVFCAFLLIPTMRAQRFASAIQGGQYDVAIAMCPRLVGVNDDTWRLSGVRVVLASPTLNDICHLERPFWLAVGTRFYLFKATLTDIRLAYITLD